MQTKLDQLKAAALANDWAGALRIAARFPNLGEYKRVIVTAHECIVNPRFYAQVGIDPATAIEAGKAALRERYGI